MGRFEYMMNYHWKEVVPIDRYIVKSNGMLHDYDRKILTLLYQPLIGTKAFSLYMSLWSELEQNRLWGNESTHHFLMAIMQLPLSEIFYERLKLEGIGLLNTYLLEEEDPKKYIYELQPPLSPKNFFYDGILNIYLYNRVGKKRYQQLKQFFSDERLSEKAKNVTRGFNEVFQSLHMSELVTNLEDEEFVNRDFVENVERDSVTIQDETFDFQLFFAGLSENLVPKKAITPAVKDAIKKLSYIYGIDPIEMKNLVIDCIDDQEEVNLEELRRAARDWYQLEYGDELPSLVEKIQPLIYKSTDLHDMDEKERRLIEQLESLSPRQFLKDISGGIEPSLPDLTIIEDVMFQQKLLPGVVNVLIYYVMLKTDMKLSKSYVEKIASHWARKGIKTVKEAMAVAKKEHRQYQEWADAKESKKRKKRIIRQEKLPSWIKEYESQEDEKMNDTDFELEKRKLEERIKNYKRKKT